MDTIVPGNLILDTETLDDHAANTSSQQNSSSNSNNNSNNTPSLVATTEISFENFPDELTKGAEVFNSVAEEAIKPMLNIRTRMFLAGIWSDANISAIIQSKLDTKTVPELEELISTLEKNGCLNQKCFNIVKFLFDKTDILVALNARSKESVSNLFSCFPSIGDSFITSIIKEDKIERGIQKFLESNLVESYANLIAQSSAISSDLLLDFLEYDTDLLAKGLSIISDALSRLDVTDKPSYTFLLKSMLMLLEHDLVSDDFDLPDTILEHAGHYVTLQILLKDIFDSKKETNHRLSDISDKLEVGSELLLHYNSASKLSKESAEKCLTFIKESSINRIEGAAYALKSFCEDGVFLENIDNPESQKALNDLLDSNMDYYFLNLPIYKEITFEFPDNNVSNQYVYQNPMFHETLKKGAEYFYIYFSHEYYLSREVFSSDDTRCLCAFLLYKYNLLFQPFLDVAMSSENLTTEYVHALITYLSEFDDALQQLKEESLLSWFPQNLIGSRFLKRQSIFKYLVQVDPTLTKSEKLNFVLSLHRASEQELEIAKYVIDTLDPKNPLKIDERFQYYVSIYNIWTDFLERKHCDVRFKRVNYLYGSDVTTDNGRSLRTEIKGLWSLIEDIASSDDSFGSSYDLKKIVDNIIVVAYLINKCKYTTHKIIKNWYDLPKLAEAHYRYIRRYRTGYGFYEKFTPDTTLGEIRNVLSNPKLRWTKTHSSSSVQDEARTYKEELINFSKTYPIHVEALYYYIKIMRNYKASEKIRKDVYKMLFDYPKRFSSLIASWIYTVESSGRNSWFLSLKKLLKQQSADQSWISLAIQVVKEAKNPKKNIDITLAHYKFVSNIFKTYFHARLAYTVLARAVDEKFRSKKKFIDIWTLQLIIDYVLAEHIPSHAERHRIINSFQLENDHVPRRNDKSRLKYDPNINRLPSNAPPVAALTSNAGIKRKKPKKSQKKSGFDSKPTSSKHSNDNEPAKSSSNTGAKRKQIKLNSKPANLMSSSAGNSLMKSNSLSNGHRSSKQRKTSFEENVTLYLFNNSNNTSGNRTSFLSSSVGNSIRNNRNNNTVSNGQRSSKQRKTLFEEDVTFSLSNNSNNTGDNITSMSNPSDFFHNPFPVSETEIPLSIFKDDDDIEDEKRDKIYDSTDELMTYN